MKNKNAFTAWWDNKPADYKRYNDPESVEEGWDACEEYYESRTCGECKHWLYPKDYGCKECEKLECDTTEDFYCKYFEQRTI